MTKPILYFATLSPPSRCVLLTAKAIELELDLKPIDLQAGEHLTPEFIQMNPQHTIPTLVDGDVIITDSHAIAAYLVDKYASNDSLYPKDLGKRAAVNSRLHLDSGHLFSRLRFLYEPILYNGSTDCPMDKIAYVQVCYDILEGFLKKSAYLCGPEMTIADFSCISTITSGDDTCRIDPSKYPKLVDWMERMAALPYYDELNNKGALELKEIFKNKLAENRNNKKK